MGQGKFEFEENFSAIPDPWGQEITVVDLVELVTSTQTELPTFKVKSIDAKDKNHFRTVILRNEKYECDCLTYIQNGIICRHVFYVSCLRQEKDLVNVQIHPRWLKNEENYELSNVSLLEDVVSKSLNSPEDTQIEHNTKEQNKTKVLKT